MVTEVMEMPMPFQNQDLTPSAPPEQAVMEDKMDQEKEIKEAIEIADEALFLSS